MAIYELMSDSIRAITETSFSAAGIRERSDLQRLLRSQIEVVSPDTLIIAEEFCEWEDSHRRIDLLGIDRQANLVVIELKRTEDGGHMELQSVRYAAMVSAMTFEKSVEVFAAYLRCTGSSVDARASILEFLKWEDADEDHFAQDVRIVLVSAEFSKELTTAVMWLNERELDIRCVRMKPYNNSGQVFIDVQQVIPLPEAEDITIKIKEKQALERISRRESSQVFQRFWRQLLEKAKAKTDLHARISPIPLSWISAGAGRAGMSFNYAIGRKSIRVELYIAASDREENKRIFDHLFLNQQSIEMDFGNSLQWQRLDDQQASRIKSEWSGSILSEESWHQLQDRMVDTMIRFEKALRPELEKLR